jgi:small subunit ribosomal protein S20
MANTRSATKNARKAKTRTVRNKAVKSNLKTLAKRMATVAASGDAAAAKSAAIAYISALDKAAKRGVVHRNAAAHVKSRLSKYVFAK